MSAVCFCFFSAPVILRPAFVYAQVASEEEIKDAQKDISDIEKRLKKETAAKKELEQDLTKIQGSLQVTQKEISKTESLIDLTKANISRKEEEINNLNKKIEAQREALKKLLQEMYYSSREPLYAVFLQTSSLSQMLGEEDYMLTLGEKVNLLVAEMKNTKQEIEGDKQDLESNKKDHEKLLVIKEVQKKNLVSEKIETQEDIADKAAIIKRLNKELSELQSDLNKIMGRSYNAKDIREAVEFASGKTGVPEGVLYGFLKKETNLGANTGQCTYEEVVKRSLANYKKYGSKYKASINLMYNRQDIFYEIVKSLGYSKDKKVSCSPSAYIGQGGAMGVSQFMSDVWRGYEAQVKSSTGHSKPDPWNLTDGVMAMALKLKKAGATSTKESAIRQASINYLGTFNKNYYEGIVYWSKNYKLLFQ